MRFIEWLLVRFAEKCNPKKKGRPMSKSPEAAEQQGYEVCEQETKSGQTVAYKTGKQLDKERQAKGDTKAAREKLGLKAKGRLSKTNLAKIETIRQELLSLRTGNENALESKIEEGTSPKTKKEKEKEKEKEKPVEKSAEITENHVSRPKEIPPLDAKVPTDAGERIKRKFERIKNGEPRSFDINWDDPRVPGYYEPSETGDMYAIREEKKVQDGSFVYDGGLIDEKYVIKYIIKNKKVYPVGIVDKTEEGQARKKKQQNKKN